MHLATNLGPRIRKLRRWQGLTQQQVADTCGITKSYLSKIESGVVPPVATLMKLSQALGIKVGTLLDQPQSEWQTVFIPARAAAETRRADNGYSFFTFALERAAKGMQPFLFEARAGEIKPHTLRHQGEEFVYVLEGQLGYKVGGERYTLNPGDSLYFNSDNNHEVEPLSNYVRWLAIFIDPESWAAESAPKTNRSKAAKPVRSKTLKS